jgi:outer membrane protein insertion porin family/translocation and assembly module TamA
VRRRAGSRTIALLGAACVLLVFASRGDAQELDCGPDDTEVRSVEFTGNRTFSDLELANGLVTTPSSWARRTLRAFGTRRCLDRTELRLDVARLLVFYRKHGFQDVQVDTLLRPGGSDAVRITFDIDEGTPVTIGQLRITGLDSVADSARVTARLPAAAGRRFDQYQLDSARYLIARRLRDGGYPLADVLRQATVDSAAGLANVELQVKPGKHAVLGSVRVDVTPREGASQQISDDLVHRLARLGAGEPYAERDLAYAQRALYRTDAYDHVDIVLDSTQLVSPTDTALDVVVRVRETEMRTVRAGLGYGTLDCVRASAEYTDVNWLRTARRFQLTGRISKIGLGEPLDMAPGICLAEARDDVYGDTLNYYLGATLQQLPLRGLLTLPTISVYSERRSEFNAYLRTTPVAVAVSRTWSRTLPVTATYILEYGRTEAQPALLCAVFSLCTQDDRERVGEYQRLGVLAGAITRDRSNHLFNPTRGSILRLDTRVSSPFTGSETDQSFAQIQGNASWYRGMGSGAVLAARLRVGAVFAGKDGFVPPQERLYAGGPSTVRGYRQNELGPIVYLANSYVERDTVVNGTPTRTFVVDSTGRYDRVVPTGGDFVVVGNLELRVPSPVLPHLLQFVLFTDVGELWSRNGDANTDVSFRDFKWTPGLGVRARSPVGPIRVDVGYNPRSLPAGAAYFDAPLQEGSSVAPLYCVSPGNTIPVRDVIVDGEVVPIQDPGYSCPPTFRAAERSGFFHRLTLNLSIGQAF